MAVRSKKDLLRRVAVGLIAVVGLGLLLAVAHLGPMAYFVVAVAAAVISIALWEYLQLARAKGYKPMIGVAMAACVGYVVATYMAALTDSLVELPAMVVVLSLVAMLIGRFNRIQGALADVAVTLLGLVYVVVTLSCLISILYSFPVPYGTFWVAYLIVVTKLSDIGAYFTGQAFGRHKLAPRLSPAKTIEGLLGGVIVAILGSLCFAWMGLVGWWEAVSLGLALAIVGQLGDLTESLLKRDAQVKDSGRIPGLGGILDMVDSLLFTAPLLYGYLWAIGL